MPNVMEHGPHVGTTTTTTENAAQKKLWNSKNEQSDVAQTKQEPPLNIQMKATTTLLANVWTENFDNIVNTKIATTATEFSDRVAKAVLKIKDRLDNHPKKRGDLRSAPHNTTRKTRVKPTAQLCACSLSRVRISTRN